MNARTNGRIVLPKNPAELLDLASKIYQKTRIGWGQFAFKCTARF